jgi:hypothetical protein
MGAGKGLLVDEVLSQLALVLDSMNSPKQARSRIGVSIFGLYLDSAFCSFCR